MNRSYHGFACLKFSASPKEYGNKKAITERIKANTTNPYKSFEV